MYDDEKIAVVAAGGKVSRKVITEAVNRGFDVTAFGRKAENMTMLSIMYRRIF